MPAERTPVLIVGAGPVGLSAATFLARQGTRPIVVERRTTVSGIPRATGLHSRTMEVFRSVGLEPAFRAVGLKIVNVGTELDEIRAGRATPLAMYGTPSIAALNDNSPLIERHTVAYDEFTPCWPLWCGQDHYEPILLDDAVRHGAEVRFGAELVSVEQDEDGVTALIENRAGGAYRIRADYLIGADGIRSRVREICDIGHQSHGVADYFVSIIFRAKIDVRGKPPFSFLLLFNPEVPGLLLFIERDRWMIGAIYHPERGQSAEDFTEQRCVEIARTVAGDPDLDVQLESVLPWEAKHMIADRYRSGRVFLAGDACHAHPPAGGFGVNAGVHDAHNLAWKLAAVLGGWASRRLLDSYEAERRPVGAATSEQAWLLFSTRHGQLTDAERASLRDFIIVTSGYRYASTAVAGADPNAKVLPVSLEFNGDPGSRAPHGWLLKDGRQLSTLDLFGDTFVLLAGQDSARWTDAAERVAKELDVPLRCYWTGASGDLVDPGDGWSSACGIGRAGAVLIRPDGYVAWRTGAGPERNADDVITEVFGHVLGDGGVQS